MQVSDDNPNYAGWLEKCSATTIMGWAAASDRPAEVTIRVNGRDVAVVRPTMVRPDVAAAGRHILSGFRYDFASPLNEGDDVSVVFPNGVGLNWACPKWGGDEGKPAGTQQELSPERPAIAAISGPPGKTLTDPLTTFSGWFAARDNRSTLSFYVNGVEQKFVQLTPRPDLSRSVKAGYVTGWSVMSDLGSEAAAGRASLTFEIRVDGVTFVKRDYDCAFPPRGASVRPLTFFVHIPKTAGQALTAMLAEHKQHLNVAYVYNDNIAQHIQEAQFIGLSEAVIDSFDVVFGHYLYGLHKNVRRPYRYLAIMRDPFDLLRSYYAYRKYSVGDPNFLRFDSIYDAVDKFRQLGVDNLQCRYLAGVRGSAPVTADDLRRAKSNIDEDFAFVGLTERMDETLAALGTYFGLEFNNIEANHGPATPETARLDMAQFRRAAAKAASFDVELYDYVRAKFWSAAPKIAAG